LFKINKSIWIKFNFGKKIQYVMGYLMYFKNIFLKDIFFLFFFLFLFLTSLKIIWIYCKLFCRFHELQDRITPVAYNTYEQLEMCPDSCEYNLKEKHFHCIWVCIKVFNCGVQWIMGSSPGQVKPKTIKLVFLASPLSMQY
jgi:hypothetical protein